MESLARVRVAVVGDFCLDAYWTADMTRSELSRETPHFTLPIVAEQYAPGGAGNVAVNAQALGVARTGAFTVLGRDWRGMLLRAALERGGLDPVGELIVEGWTTPCYIKPIRQGYASQQEDARLDFANYTALGSRVEEELIAILKRSLDAFDVVLICDQLEHGVVTQDVRNTLIELARAHLNTPFIADSRTRIASFTDVALKPNELELARAMGYSLAMDARDTATIGHWGTELSRQRHWPVYVTLGANGALVCTGEDWRHVPAVRLDPPLDIVGAGDTFLAALGSSLAAGATPTEAAVIANLAAAVTVKKIGQTGTATPAEILASFERWTATNSWSMKTG
jgi:rfaE bifunctional protein kinase chain/domain